jgi:hypothetical protein
MTAAFFLGQKRYFEPNTELKNLSASAFSCLVQSKKRGPSLIFYIRTMSNCSCV